MSMSKIVKSIEQISPPTKEYFVFLKLFRKDGSSLTSKLTKVEAILKKLRE